MIGQIDLYGVFVPALATLVLAAYVLFRIVTKALRTAGFYRLVWHRPLFDLALFVILLGGLCLTTRWYQA